MPIKPKKLEKEVLAAGFILEKDKGKGDHRRHKHPDGRTTEISFHSGEVSKWTENKIRKQAGLE